MHVYAHMLFSVLLHANYSLNFDGSYPSCGGVVTAKEQTAIYHVHKIIIGGQSDHLTSYGILKIYFFLNKDPGDFHFKNT